jgi:hypothetical protein
VDKCSTETFFKTDGEPKWVKKQILRLEGCELAYMLELKTDSLIETFVVFLADCQM